MASSSHQVEHLHKRSVPALAPVDRLAQTTHDAVYTNTGLAALVVRDTITSGKIGGSNGGYLQHDELRERLRVAPLGGQRRGVRDVAARRLDLVVLAWAARWRHAHWRRVHIGRFVAGAGQYGPHPAPGVRERRSHDAADDRRRRRAGSAAQRRVHLAHDLVGVLQMLRGHCGHERGRRHDTERTHRAAVEGRRHATQRGVRAHVGRHGHSVALEQHVERRGPVVAAARVRLQYGDHLAVATQREGGGACGERAHAPRLRAAAHQERCAAHFVVRRAARRVPRQHDAVGVEVVHDGVGGVGGGVQVVDEVRRLGRVLAGAGEERRVHDAQRDGLDGERGVERLVGGQQR
eukprot:PhM_4_TR10065/c0_g1_i1/m.103903